MAQNIIRYYGIFSLILWTFSMLRGVHFGAWSGLEMLFPGADNSYWLLLLLGVEKWVMHPALSLVLDGFVFSLSVYLAFRPRLWATNALGILWLLFAIFYNLTGLHHSHIWFPLGFLGLALGLRLLPWFRLYACFAMGSAAVWKLLRGSWFHALQMPQILARQQADYASLEPQGLWAEALAWLLVHPSWAYALWLGACVLELAFVVGFFTRRWDGILALLLGLFVVFDFLVMGLHFWPWLAFLWGFGTWQKNDKIWVWA